MPIVRVVPRWLRAPLLLLAAVLAIAVADRESGLLAWSGLRDDLEQRRVRVAQLEAETRALRAEVDALEREPFALERAIREDLGLVQPGETFVRLRSDGSPNARFP